MVSIVTAGKMALSLAGVEEKEHFGHPSFRVKNKIFMTLWPADKRAMVRLPIIEQSVFCSFPGEVFFPVPGKWGAGGATFVDLTKVRKGMLQDAIGVAYRHTAPKSARSVGGSQS
jgi:hypothetical protein